MNARHLIPSSILMLVLAAVMAPSGVALEAAAVFNEIQYNPAGPGEPEWIELRNRQSTDVDLSGWRLTGGVDFTFPNGTAIRAGGYLVISDNPAGLQNAAGVTGVLGPWTGSLNNSGETLRLRDLSGRLMDEMEYNDRGRWPAGADGSGATLARKGGHISGAAAEGWSISGRIGGSPGAGNEAETLGPVQAIFGLADPWLYQDTSSGLAAGWAGANHTAGTGGWLSGNGVLAFEEAALPAAVGSTLANPATHPSGTYYFQKQFAFSGNPASARLTLRMLLDDGAVIYLNGQEVLRRSMPAGIVSATTPASAEVANAAIVEVPLPAQQLVAGTNTLSVEVHQAGKLVVPQGGGSGLALIQSGGSLFATNYCRQAGAIAFAKDLLGNGAHAPTHTIPNLNNGSYGNPSSWIGNSDNSFCGVSFGATAVTIGSVAWGRDNTGTYSDRCAGLYTLQYTTVPNPNASTVSWTTIGTVTYPAGYSLRHAYSFPEVSATGIRLIVPGNGITTGGCIDELEAGPAIPPPAPVFRHMTTGGTMDNATNMALGATPFAKDVIPGYPSIHITPYLNDGIYGNSNSWIGNSANSFAGISFSSTRQIGRIAWGRDNTGSYTDRAEGSYAIQYTTTASPNASTPDAAWTTIGTIAMDAGIGSPSLRHLLEFSPVTASGIRIIAPTGACIDELEIYGPVAPDVVWGAALEFREALPPASAIPLVINEIGGANDAVWRVELKNTGADPLDIGGLILAGSEAPLAGYTFASQVLAPGALLVWDETQIGFRPAADDRLFLYAPGRSGLAGAAIVRPAGRSRDDSGRMLVPVSASFGAANSFSLTEAIVISEIMYHTPASNEEWIELHNKSAAAVDVSGWRLDDAVSFTIPPATTIPSGGYLVISNAAASLRAKWPAVAGQIIGDFSGGLGNSGERIALEDAVGNPADEVIYADGGSWPSQADGGGSSLELRDFAADNGHPGSWAASDESGKSAWQTFTWRTVSGQPFGPNFWNELRLGLLDAGICLVDDVRVTRDPDGAAQQLIQNGSFATSAAWRLLGNHGTSGIVTDGGNGSVLRLIATGPAETNHNHAETTFASNTALLDGQTYEVSLRARWISGQNKLGVRGYFSRLAKSVDLPIPQNLGSPGAPNPQAAIVGPALSALRHFPVVPSPAQSILVSCEVADSRPVTGVTLYYRTAGAFAPVPMTAAGNLWSAAIPAQPAATVVQFYVEVQNAAGGISRLPAGGQNSRALCIVDDGQRSTIPAQELRVIMLPAESAAMLSPLNLLSNATTGGTLIAGGADVFYDVGVRLQGSAAGRARDGTDFQGINVELNADQPYLGIYHSIGFDRSGRSPANRRPDEIYGKHFFHRAGLPCTRDDLAYLIGPTTTYSGHCILQLNGYNGQFADDQFGDDSGNVFNFDGTYEPTSTTDGNVQSLKNPVPFTHHQTDLTNLGDDKEHYRAPFDIRAGKSGDDYAGLIAMCKAMGVTDATFAARTADVIDVDQWMRCTALVNLLCVEDTWFTGGFPHNARFFVPAYGKATLLPWDMDFMLYRAANSPVNMTTGNLNRLTAVPANNRAYLAHVRDLCLTVLDPGYVQQWLAHYGSVTNHNYSAEAAWLAARRTHALSVLPAGVPFAITTNGGADFSVNAHQTTLTGNGGLDIREIRRAGSAVPLAVRWTGNTTWQADIPLTPGSNAITLEAVGFDGAVLTAVSIAITDTLPAPTPREFLRITEINYHPADPSTPAELAASSEDDDFEFIELQNIGTGTLDLTGVSFTDGIVFTFPAGALLGAGQFVVVVKNSAAFTARYGAGINVAGTYPNDNLNNNGETVTLVDATGAVIQSFTYSEDWAPHSDGPGYSLVIRSSSGPVSAWQTAAGWTLSSTLHGAPGAPAGTVPATEFELWRHTHFDAAELLDPLTSGAGADPLQQGITNLVRFALGISQDANARDFLPKATLVGGSLRIEFRRQRHAVDIQYAVETSGDLAGWSAVNSAPVILTDNGDGTETVRVEAPAAPDRAFVRLQILVP